MKNIYTPVELRELAADKGPLYDSLSRAALKYAADVIDAANIAIAENSKEANRLRAALDKSIIDHELCAFKLGEMRRAIQEEADYCDRWSKKYEGLMEGRHYDEQHDRLLGYLK